MNVVVLPQFKEEAPGEHATPDVPLPWTAFRGMVLVQRSPGAQIVPAKIGRQAEDARLPFPFADRGSSRA